MECYVNRIDQHSEVVKSFRMFYIKLLQKNVLLFVGK